MGPFILTFLIMLAGYLVLSRIRPLTQCGRCHGKGCKRCRGHGHKFRAGTRITHHRRR